MTEPLQSTTRFILRGVVVLPLVVLSGCQEAKTHSGNLTHAEGFIDAFYSFDPAALERYAEAAEELPTALYYQAWAEAAHYRIKHRRACTQLTTHQFECRITVVDDFGTALGYTATDTFTLRIDEGIVHSVTFVGDDPPVFAALFEWIGETQPAVLTGPCKDMFAGGDTPADCARAVAEAAREFATLPRG